MIVIKHAFFLIEILIKKHTEHKYKIHSIDSANNMVVIIEIGMKRKISMSIDELYFNHDILYKLCPSEAFLVSWEYNKLRVLQ